MFIRWLPFGAAMEPYNRRSEKGSCLFTEFIIISRQSNGGFVPFFSNPIFGRQKPSYLAVRALVGIDDVTSGSSTSTPAIHFRDLSSRSTLGHACDFRNSLIRLPQRSGQRRLRLAYCCIRNTLSVLPPNEAVASTLIIACQIIRPVIVACHFPILVDRKPPEHRMPLDSRLRHRTRIVPRLPIWWPLVMHFCNIR